MSLFCCLNKGNCCEVESMDPQTGFGAPVPVILSIRSNRQTSSSGQGDRQQQQQSYRDDGNNITMDSPSRSPPLFNTPTPIQTPAPHSRGDQLYDSEGHRISRRVVESDHPTVHHHHQRMGPGCGLDPIPNPKKVQYTGSAAGGGQARNPGHLLERDDRAMTGYNVDHPPESYPGYSGGGWPIGYTSAVSGKSILRQVPL